MIWNLGKFTPYGECYPRDLFCQIVSNPMKGASDGIPESLLHKDSGIFFFPRATPFLPQFNFVLSSHLSINQRCAQ